MHAKRWLIVFFRLMPIPGGTGSWQRIHCLFSTVILSASFVSLPPSLDTLIQSALVSESTEEDIQEKLRAATRDRSNAIILHGPSGRAGALDLESKCTESALIASSVSDFRNFAHGRHNWINRFGDESFVVAFVGPGEGELAQRTLALIPKHVSHVTVPLGANFAIAQILSTYYSIRIAGWLGDLHGVDPGRPTHSRNLEESYTTYEHVSQTPRHVVPSGKQLFAERPTR